MFFSARFQNLSGTIINTDVSVTQGDIMVPILILASILIQVLAIIMILYTFRSISEEKGSDLGVLARYYIVRSRLARLRMSLLFVAALVFVQLMGLIYLIAIPEGPITFTQLLISDIIFIALGLFLSTIYKSRKYLDIGLSEDRPTKMMKKSQKGFRRKA